MVIFVHWDHKNTDWSESKFISESKKFKTHKTVDLVRENYFLKH